MTPLNALAKARHLRQNADVHGLDRLDEFVCNCGEPLGECPRCGAPIFCNQVVVIGKVGTKAHKALCPECGEDMNLGFRT